MFRRLIENYIVKHLKIILIFMAELKGLKRVRPYLKFVAV
jgi:hypothetical protein